MATSDERRRAARIGGLSLHLHGNSKAISERARRGLEARFRREVDPDGVLPPDELEKKLKQAKRLHFTRLAHKSAAARRGRKGSRGHP